MIDHYQNIPAELKGLPRWVLWRFVQVGGRKTKVPFQRNGSKASSTDPATWCSFHEAVEARTQGFDGLGFVFNGDGITGIDLDKHRNPDTGDLDEFARAIVDDLGSYTEVSPSGTGLHVIVRATIPGESGRRDAKQGLEAYCQARFFCMTGQHLSGTPATVEHRQAEVERFYAKHFTPKPEQPSLTVQAPAPVALAGDEDLLRRAAGASNGAKFSALWRGDWAGSYGSQSEADAALLGLLYFWTQGDQSRAFSLFARSGLNREKWAAREDYRNDTWAKVANGPTYDPAHRTPAPTAAPGGKGLPIIKLPGNGVSVTDCARELFALIGPTRSLFNRGGACMRLAADDRGQSQLVAFGADEAKSFFEKHGELMAWRKGEGGEFVLKPIVCPTDTALALLASQERRELLPTIRGLIGCPMLREVNGELHTAGPGYDAATGYYVTGGQTPPTVPLGEAVDSLWQLLGDFAFQTPADAARALAMLLTPALKVGGFIAGHIPAEVAEADCSQSGKTYRLRVTAAVYNELPAMVTQRKGGVGSADESFSEALVRGRPFVLLDNWRGQLSSAHIEAFLTARGPFGCRLPHRGNIDVDPERFFVSMSSNGAESTRDFVNRACIVRIKKQPPGYPFRKFPEGDLLAHVEAQQPYFLGCLHSIIREWHRLGKPLSNEHRHDFRAWARALDWICQHILHSDPILDGHAEIQARVSNPDQGWLRALMLEISESNRLGEWFSASGLLEVCEGAGLAVPGLKPEADETRGRQRIGILMAKLLKDTNRIAVDGLTITRETRDEARTDGGGPVFHKGYVVTRQNSTSQAQ